jgi:hypothetical protein
MRRLGAVASLLFLGLLGSASCSGNGNDGGFGETVSCTPSTTRGCVGAGNCAGGQLCNTAGNAYTSCICENDAGEIDVDGSLFHVGEGGTMPSDDGSVKPHSDGGGEDTMASNEGSAGESSAGDSGSGDTGSSDTGSGEDSSSEDATGTEDGSTGDI